MRTRTRATSARGKALSSGGGSGSEGGEGESEAHSGNWNPRKRKEGKRAFFVSYTLTFPVIVAGGDWAAGGSTMASDLTTASAEDSDSTTAWEDSTMP